MRTLILTIAALIGSGLVADEPKPKTPTPRQAVNRALIFLEKDTAQWRKDRQCATCHHGIMTVWAMSEAKSLGYPIASETLADVTKWTKERLENIDKPRDTRMGWNMVSTPALYLDVMALDVPQQEATSSEERRRIAGHLLRHQEADGSWAWSLAPAQNRAPPHFESDEVVTLLAYLALQPQVPSDPKEKSEVREGRDKAAAWLAKTKPNDTTQAAGLRLLKSAWAKEPEKNLQSEIDDFLHRQNKDGGWSQAPNLPSDAYATGQALYFLSLAGVMNDRPEIQRGVAFLVATQKEDGAWTMTPRAHEGAKPAKNAVPITYFGSAWATLGLLRSVPR